MSSDVFALLLLGGLVVYWLIGRRGRGAAPAPDQVARIEALLADLDVRLKALEQWAAETPTAASKNTRPLAAPGEPLSASPAPLPAEPLLATAPHPAGAAAPASVPLAVETPAAVPVA